LRQEVKSVEERRANKNMTHPLASVRNIYNLEQSEIPLTYRHHISGVGQVGKLHCRHLSS
jgi:hypothetical protein